MLKIDWSSPVPDGGGGNNPYLYNLIEIRAQPLVSMTKKDYLITSSNSSLSKTLYVLDPEADGVKWTTLRLVFEARREPLAEVARYVYVSFSTACGNHILGLSDSMDHKKT